MDMGQNDFQLMKYFFDEKPNQPIGWKGKNGMTLNIARVALSLDLNSRFKLFDQW
jgi:hypothetical protein